MITLFLDIETLPGPETLRDAIWDEVRPPGNYVLDGTIQKWNEEQKPLKVEEEYRRTALRGHKGQLLCIGYIKEGPRAAIEGIIKGYEPEMLKEFWDVASDADLFVGFNILDFDLKFIIQRSIIHRIKPTRTISFARYRNDPVYDVMAEWEQWGRSYVKLDELALALGLESPKCDLDGGQVYDYYLDGRLQEIYDYCLRDVHTTRNIYRRMTFKD